jgi:predicted lipoprotein with Yx(FWY)xxD motif
VVIQLTKLYRSVIMLLAASALLAIMAVAETGNYTVDISFSKFLGNFLVNQSGYTLYYLQNDSQLVGDSACFGECADLWHPFYVARLILPESLRRVDFGEITRADGSKQTTFRDWPLYLYAKDIMPGDTRGEGINGTWHIIVPEDQPRLI